MYPGNPSPLLLSARHSRRLKIHIVKKMTGYLQIIFCFLVLPQGLFAQDIEQSIEMMTTRLQEPFSYQGNLGIQVSTYHSNLGIDRSPPFSGIINAALNLEFLGINTPVTFLYSSGGTAFNVTLPSFGFAGISPSFRGYTLHLGDRTMELGKYSFSNHSFRGAGAEVNKERWYSRAFFGRLQRAQISDFHGFQYVDPLLRRMGGGALIGYTPNNSSRIECSLFKAWDDVGSLPQDLSDSTYSIHAGENVIFSTAIEQKLAAKLNFEFNYSTSGFTERQDLSRTNSVSFLKSFLGMLEVNKSTRWKHALETRLEFQTRYGQLSLAYEKIDPGYRTLGALFFQDDQENITGGLVTRIFDSRISLIANGGLQRNNLAADKSDEYRRFIGSVYAGYQASKKLSLNLGFSNFSAVNRQVRILDPNNPNILTELALTNLNLNGGLQYRLSLTNQIAFNYLFQQNQTITTMDEIQEEVNDLQNYSLLFQNIWKSTGISSSLQFFINRFNMPQLNQIQRGIALNSSKSFNKNKIRTTMGFSYNYNRQENSLTRQEVSGNLFQTRLGFSWQVQSRQSLQLDGIIYSNHGENINSFSESRFNIRYTVNLQSNPDEKK